MARLLTYKALKNEPVEVVRHIYNGLDCCITLDVYDGLRGVVDNDPHFSKYYRFEMGLMNPAWQMMDRGIKVDLSALDKLKSKLVAAHYAMSGIEKVGKAWKITNKDALFPQIAEVLTGEQFSYRQTKKLSDLLYSTMACPPVYDRSKKTRTPSTGEAALESLRSKYPSVRVVIDLVLALRGLDKDIDMLSKQLPNGRFYSSFKPAGTKTGRFSSSANNLKHGSGAQNIRKEMRQILVADEGYTMCYADLKNAENYGAAYISEDENYMEACHSGDVHTSVAALCFGIPQERKEADQYYYRHFTYRDMAKRGGHGSSYLLTPRSMANKLKIEQKIAFRFQAQFLGMDLPKAEAKRLELLDLDHYEYRVGEGIYVHIKGAFEGMRKVLHEGTLDKLVEDGYIINPLGRKSHFYGDVTDAKILREAVAFLPQSTVADVLNMGLYKVWQHLEPEGLQILAQVHDAILFQVPIGTEKYFMGRVRELCEIPINVKGRQMIIPMDLTLKSFGSNWKEIS